MIEIRAEAIVGLNFSKLCRRKYDEDGKAYEIEFLYPDLEEKVKSSFDDEEVHPSEVTPELISLLLDLEFFPIQDSHDAYIGVCVRDINIGTSSVSMCNFSAIESAFRQVQIKLKDISVAKDMIYFILNGSVHTLTEDRKIEE